MLVCVVCTACVLCSVGGGESWLRVFYCLCGLFALLVCVARWEGGELVEGILLLVCVARWEGGELVEGILLLVCVVCAACVLCSVGGGRVG